MAKLAPLLHQDDDTATVAAVDGLRPALAGGAGTVSRDTDSLCVPLPPVDQGL